MIDCFDGMVFSGAIGTRPNAELVNAMLDAAIDRVTEAKLVRSMWRNGCSLDNAPCEGFFGMPKTEMFFARGCLSTNIEDFVAALDAYIRWYNEVRIKSSLGFRSPAEHRWSMSLAAQLARIFHEVRRHLGPRCREW